MFMVALGGTSPCEQAPLVEEGPNQRTDRHDLTLQSLMLLADPQSALPHYLQNCLAII